MGAQEKTLAARGEPHPAGRPPDQFGAQLGLQFDNVRTERRLADAESFRGSAESTVPGDGAKSLHTLQTEVGLHPGDGTVNHSFSEIPARVAKFFQKSNSVTTCFLKAAGVLPAGVRSTLANSLVACG